MQNVIGLVQLRNQSTSHAGTKDAQKLVDLLKKYLTPPGEILEQVVSAEKKVFSISMISPTNTIAECSMILTSID